MSVSQVRNWQCGSGLSGRDVELLQMVRTLDEMDTVINLLSERVADWHQIRHPSFSRKYRRTPALCS